MTGRKLREFLPDDLERGADLDTGSPLLREIARIPVEVNFPASTPFSAPR